MRAELANLSHCAVLFLSRAVNLCWYDNNAHNNKATRALRFSEARTARKSHVL